MSSLSASATASALMPVASSEAAHGAPTPVGRRPVASRVAPASASVATVVARGRVGGGGHHGGRGRGRLTRTEGGGTLVVPQSLAAKFPVALKLGVVLHGRVVLIAILGRLY